MGVVGPEAGADHQVLVDTVKEHQRSSELAREGWRHYCDALGGGLRDPQKHESAFLEEFLQVFREGQLPQAPVERDPYEVQVVRSCSAFLGAEQITLSMPSSEAGIMKEVVDNNSYSFAPGRGCVLASGDIVLDIGAHVGVVAALALRTPGVSVVSVEPHPVTFGFLEQNLRGFGERARVLQRAVSDSCEERALFSHKGTNNPSRLFFSSLFDTRRHDDETISVQCMRLPDLIRDFSPTVVKIDAEGAERFLLQVDDFCSVRLMIVEWDWTHNRQRQLWDDVEQRLQDNGFKIKIKGYMPVFAEDGTAVLTDSRGKKRGQTGMIFTATRKTAKILSDRRSWKAPDDPTSPPAAVPVQTSAEQTYLLRAGEQPPLREQLNALSIEQMVERLEQLGEKARPVQPQEFFVAGFQGRRRTELLDALCQAYAAKEVATPRRYVHGQGLLIPEELADQMLAALSSMPFEEHARPKVHAAGYCILKRPTSTSAQYHERDPRHMRRQVWDAAERILRQASPKAGAYDYTAIAVSRGFRGSPHIDQNDLSVQYAFSLGDFEAGGELCVEEDPFLVRVLNTHGRLVCIDGRFPHWVSGYSGERYSVIFYRSAGVEDPRTCAVHEL
eukprot:TRINITY_DN59761_c0_g1_i1.p1 TRINITY_DN59761_c0_g1~~TRINITY_DN59761_c0_g1_i1.p1  ORF type:complete len:635 (+),score=57.99 TRINITY_DN59761_c0_g1_i1:63-1907(+)